jgi:hypothetical protein
MEKEIIELINLATAKGFISQEHEELIYTKARALGISDLETKLYIDSRLSTDNNSKPNPITEEKEVSNWNWKDVKSYSYIQYVYALSVIIILIAGLFPWIESRVSSSGFGASFSAKGSYAGGLQYTIPSAIAAIVFLVNNKLVSKRLYFGIGLLLIALAIGLSYQSSASYSGGGATASASTNAGPGIGVLMLGALIYILAAVLEKSKENSKLQRILKIIVELILTSYAFSLLYTFHLQGVSNDLITSEKLVTKLLFLFAAIAAIVYIKRNLKFQYLYFPLIFVLSVISFDVLLRSVSLFSNEIDKIAILTELSIESPEAWLKSNEMKMSPSVFSGWLKTANWFATDLHFQNTLENIDSSLLFRLKVIKILNFVLVLFLNIILWPVAYRGMRIAFKLLNFKKGVNFIDGISDRFRGILAGRWEKRGTLSNYWIRNIGLIVVILFALRIIANFMYNQYGYNLEKTQFVNRVQAYQEKAKAVNVDVVVNSSADNNQAPASSFGDEFTNLTNKEGHLIGLWNGKLRDKDLMLFIEKIEGNEVFGYNIVGGNKRPLKGSISEIIENDISKCSDRGHSVKMKLQEPGDDKWDGVFDLTLTVCAAIDPSSGKLFSKTFSGIGNWKSNNGKLDGNIELSK